MVDHRNGPMVVDLAIGVLSAPDAHARRDSIRRTWVQDATVSDSRVAVRFVLGRWPEACVRSAEAEAAAHKDVMFVATHDCSLWYAAEKVHLWFKTALTTFPSAQWLAKSEDDTVLWPSAVLTDLLALSADTDYYGSMSWQGSCRRPRKPWEPEVDCAGCYGGALINGPSLCRPSLCRAASRTAVRCCQIGCPRSTRMVPFAIGALDARRRSFARSIASCAYADSFFTRLSAGSHRLSMLCMTTDGAQGHAIGECVSRVHVADALERHLDGVRSCSSAPGSRCADGAVGFLHPLKRKDARSWNGSWLSLTQRHAYSPRPLVEAVISGLGPGSPASSKPPRLRLTRELHGRRFVGNQSVSDVWASRGEYLLSVVSQHARRFSQRGRATGQRAAGTPLSAGQPAVARSRPRRRLRQQVWALNCSRIWAAARR